MKADGWYVYIVRCSDNSLYCGISLAVEHRIKIHNLGKGAKYTRTRRPVKLVASVGPMSGTEARRLEMLVKGLPRAEKVDYLLSYKEW